MTKSLTEQMKTEHGAWYYVKTKEWGICHWLLFPDTLEFEKDIIEVLAPVPSYDEWKHTKAKLKKATELNCNHAYKTNKRKIQINNLKNENNQLREQLKEKNIKLNELRHQRNEANEVIKLITTENRDCYNEAREYLEKWGVK